MVLNEKMRGMASESSDQYGVQVNVKLGTHTREMLRLVAEFEDVKPSELVRHWIREKIAEYRKDRLFLKFFEKREARQKET